MPDMTQFDRTARLMGKQAVAKLGHARMAVFGLGAVGSFAVEALARAGVGYLRLVDFDRVDMSNINRQLYALHSTLGEKKQRLPEPGFKIFIRPVMWTSVTPL